VNKTLKATALAIAVAGAAAVAANSAYAVDVIFDPGTVAYGYSDGYWSRDHVWHTWEKPEYVEMYRKYPSAQYHEWVHTRDADQGWVEIHH
jgi:hypothetical protein